MFSCFQALIIAVDELKPEQSDAIISELTVNDQNTASTYQKKERTYPPGVLQKVPLDKSGSYILVHPDDLKELKSLDAVSVEDPKVLAFPESSSSESYERGSYTKYPHDKPTYSSGEVYTGGSDVTSGSRYVKYPSRPAPPLTTYSGSESSKEEQDHNDSLYVHKGYTEYIPPNSSPYKSIPINDGQKTSPNSAEIGHNYENYRPNSYSSPSSYSVPSDTYGHLKPNAYSETSEYIPHEHSKPTSYSAPSNYEISKPNLYSDNPDDAGRQTSDFPGPSTFMAPQIYDDSKPDTYDGPYYGTSKSNSYSGPTNYERSKSKDYSNPSTYGDSKPSAYSGSTYKEPKTDYGSHKISSHTSTSSYPGPQTSYTDSKAPYSITSTYTKSNNPHYDSSGEDYRSNSKKHLSDTYEEPGKTYSYTDYAPPKTISNPSDYETDPHYVPKVKPYKTRYYDSPSQAPESEKPSTYGDYSTPYSKQSHIKSYESPHSSYTGKSTYDSEKDTYTVTSKPSYEIFYRNPSSNSNAPSSRSKKKQKLILEDLPYSYNTAYGKKSYNTPFIPSTYKPKMPYNENAYIRPYVGSTNPTRPYLRKRPYDSLKTSYGTLRDPSSYEEPTKTSDAYRYPPSYKSSSKVHYDQQSYNENPPRTKSAVSNNYEDTPYSDNNKQREYHYTYDSPSTVTDDTTYKSSPVPSKYVSKYEDSPPKDGPPSYHQDSSLEYGARYPTSYKKSRHVDSKVIYHPPVSSFTLQDAKSSDDVHHNTAKKPGSGIKESHSHYHHYHEDSSEIPDNHSAKKNYSPVRPAPTKDQYESPLYPPLPRRAKGGKYKNHYNSEEDHSKDSNENYKSQPTYTETKSFDPVTYTSDYKHDSYRNPPAHRDTNRQYPLSQENVNYHHSDDHSSSEEDEPRVYTKTTTMTYTKPYKDSSEEHGYDKNTPADNTYKPPTSDYLRTRVYTSPEKDIVVSQPEYTRPSYQGSQKYVGSYSHPSPYTTNGKLREFYENSTLPISYSSLSEILPPKRVEGVVYRSRKSYPYIKSYRRNKGYLPYKHHYPKSSSAYEYKPIQGMSSEIREKNTTEFVLQEKSAMKSKPESPKQSLRYSSYESAEKYGDSVEDSSHAAIPGEPGKDYPILKEIPHNHFSCENKLPGFYADVENRCQVSFYLKFLFTYYILSFLLK